MICGHIHKHMCLYVYLKDLVVLDSIACEVPKLQTMQLKTQRAVLAQKLITVLKERVSHLDAKVERTCQSKGRQAVFPVCEATTVRRMSLISHRFRVLWATTVRTEQGMQRNSLARKDTSGTRRWGKALLTAHPVHLASTAKERDLTSQLVHVTPDTSA